MLVIIKAGNTACNLQLPHIPRGLDQAQRTNQVGVSRNTETYTQAGKAERLRKRAQHNQVVVLSQQVHAEFGAAVVHVGFVERQQSALVRRIADGADFGLAHQAAARIVRVRHEGDLRLHALHDVDVLVYLRIEILAGGRKYGAAAFTVRINAVEREARLVHQHGFVRLGERTDDHRDDLGFTRTTHHALGVKTVFFADGDTQVLRGPVGIQSQPGLSLLD